MTTNLYETIQDIIELRVRYYDLIMLSHLVHNDKKAFDDIIREKAEITEKLNEYNFSECIDENTSMVNILVFAYEHPGVGITHNLFDDNEFIYYDINDDVVKDENGNVFETWVPGKGYNGLITRYQDERWQNGWRVYNNQ
jgi:hypothetical protein